MDRLPLPHCFILIISVGTWLWSDLGLILALSLYDLFPNDLCSSGHPMNYLVGPGSGVCLWSSNPQNIYRAAWTCSFSRLEGPWQLLKEEVMGETETPKHSCYNPLLCSVYSNGTDTDHTNNDQHLLSGWMLPVCMAGAFLSAFWSFTYFILITNLWGRYKNSCKQAHFPHFTGEETEKQKS